MRDDEWLISRFFGVWDRHFSDISKENKIVVRFKGKWKNKFGHIKMKNGVTEIVINGLFRHYDVPEEVIDLTLAHEICHYIHGFQSPLVRKYKHPHAGGVVSKELKKRGLGNSLRREKQFVKSWWSLYNRIHPNPRKTTSRFIPRIIVRHFK